MSRSRTILTLSGSLREGSVNQLLIDAAVDLAPVNYSFTHYRKTGLIPHFNAGLKDNIDEVIQFRKEIRKSDAILICTPEYAFGIPGTLKNALDWLVSEGELYQKAVAIISASPLATGGIHAFNDLERTLQAQQAMMSESCKLQVPVIHIKMNAEGIISDEELIKDLTNLWSGMEELIIQSEQIELPSRV